MHPARRRVVAAAGAVALIATLATVPAFGADSHPPSGDSAISRAQPHVAGYRLQDIRDWSPQSDPHARYLRSHVPLQARNAPFAATQANPELDGKAEVMLMQGDYGNSFFESTTANNTFSDYALTFWQYADYWSPWHGSASVGVPKKIYDPHNSDWRNRGFEFGILTIPNPAYTDAAHRNGVKTVAIIYFDPYFRPGLTFHESFDKDPNSEGYIIANKLVEMAKYYGFDGYFLNQEEAGDDSEFKPFMAYLTKQGLYTQWYDTNSNFDSDKAQWLKDDKHGQIHNSVFVNYDWPYYADQISNFATANGYDPYREVFVGVEAAQNRFDGGHSSGSKLPTIYAPGTKNPRTSVALFTPSDYYQRDLDSDLAKFGVPASTGMPYMQQSEYQWMIHERERMYFSGVNADPKRTGATQDATRPDVAVRRANGWVGVADFTPARSVIKGDVFYSSFNTGKGMRWYDQGQVTREEEWTDIASQSLLPSWQWWVDTTGARPNVDFDYGPEPRKNVQGEAITPPFTPQGAFTGGSSLVIHGSISAPATLRLFKTDLTVAADARAEVTWKKTTGAGTNLALALIFADAPQEVINLPLGEGSTQWATSTVDLSAYAGRQLASMGLTIDGQAEATQFNVGQLRLTHGQAAAPPTPTGLQLDTWYATGEAEVSWDKGDFGQVDSYLLQAVDAEGATKFLAAGFTDARHIKNVAVAGDFTLRLYAVGKDGQLSAPAELPVATSSLPSALTLDEATDSNGYFTQAARPGEVTVHWQPPATGAPAAGYVVRVETLYEEETSPFGGYGEVQVGPEATSATLPAPREGLPFNVTVQPRGGQTVVAGTALRGRYHDAWAHPLEGRDYVTQ